MNRDSGWRQTLEPRVSYLYSEYEDQSSLPLFDTSELNFSFNQLFRDDRFSGGDRIADADQVAFALTSRFLNPQGKETVLRLVEASDISVSYTHLTLPTILLV